jgi:hypothetical protein
MEMSPARVAVAIAAIPLFIIAGVSSFIVFHQIVDAVNQRLPQDRQFDPLWWYWPKTQKLMVEYRRFYPDRTLEKKVKALGVVGFAVLLVVAWAIGFFR